MDMNFNDLAISKNEGIFDRFILLYGAARAGKIKKICDGSFREMVISGDLSGRSGHNCCGGLGIWLLHIGIHQKEDR